MTKLLIIDTETTGINPTQARLVELAAILWDCDKGCLERYSTLIQPVDFDIPAGAQAVHGISVEQAMDEGVPLKEALAKLTNMVLDCRKPPEPRVYIPGVPYRLVAHNLRYDVQVLAGEYVRTGSKAYPLNYLSPFCTMTALTDRCALPGRFGKYKWPRLEEAWAHCFGDLLAEAELFALEDPKTQTLAPHRAMFDAEACRRIYMFGLERKWWSHD